MPKLRPVYQFNGNIKDLKFFYTGEGRGNEQQE